MSKENEKNVATTTLVNALVYNNRFASVKLDADQLGAEGLSQWKSIVLGLQRSAYEVGAYCENNGLKVESNTVNKTPVYDALRVILNSLGEVKGHKLYANEEAVIAIIGYACRRANLDSPELKLCLTRMSGLRREITLAKSVNGLNPDYIKELEDDLAKAEEKKVELLATADMRIKQVTMSNASSFRLDLEHYLARVIGGQLAKSLAELDAEEAERKAKRAEKAKARKLAKKQAQVNA